MGFIKYFLLLGFYFSIDFAEYEQELLKNSKLFDKSFISNIILSDEVLLPDSYTNVLMPLKEINQTFSEILKIALSYSKKFKSIGWPAEDGSLQESKTQEDKKVIHIETNDNIYTDGSRLLIYNQVLLNKNNHSTVCNFNLLKSIAQKGYIEVNPNFIKSMLRYDQSFGESKNFKFKLLDLDNKNKILAISHDFERAFSPQSKVNRIRFIPLTWDKKLNNFFQLTQKELKQIENSIQQIGQNINENSFSLIIGNEDYISWSIDTKNPLSLQFEDAIDAKFYISDTQIRQKLSWANNKKEVQSMIEANQNFAYCGENTSKLTKEFKKLLEEYKEEIIFLHENNQNVDILVDKKTKLFQEQIKPNLNKIIQSFTNEKDTGVQEQKSEAENSMPTTKKEINKSNEQDDSKKTITSPFRSKWDNFWRFFADLFYPIRYAFENFWYLIKKVFI